MSIVRLAITTSIAMIAFAGNSLLCRVALTTTSMDAASFTAIRLLSGAITLYVLILLNRRIWSLGGNWLSAMALFGYAAGFSFAYLSLSAATGALLLFGAVQCTMIGYGLIKGERMNLKQTLGVLVAVSGLVVLLMPGLTTPPIISAMLMFGAGVSWGIYSLRGRGVSDATRETAGNFLRAVPFALFVSIVTLQRVQIDLHGAGLAVASGALASGFGYAIWYSVLPALRATSAATVQLTVPVLTTVGGVVFLSESVTLRLGLASAAILGGVAIYIFGKGYEKN
ncbi:MAG TPA: DMT family transporter [Sulfurovum sp.]|nr:DMT family transporter [Sulfurovum sp.]